MKGISRQSGNNAPGAGVLLLMPLSSVSALSYIKGSEEVTAISTTESWLKFTPDNCGADAKLIELAHKIDIYGVDLSGFFSAWSKEVQQQLLLYRQNRFLVARLLKNGQTELYGDLNQGLDFTYTYSDKGQRGFSYKFAAQILTGRRVYTGPALTVSTEQV